MAVNLSPVGGVAAQFFTSTGAVLTGGKLYTYAAGTTTPAVTYTTSQGNVPWTNPVVLDAAGRVPGSGEIWLTDGIIYKFVLKDSNDVLIATYDNITGINSNAVAYTNQQEIVTATAGQTVFNLGISYQPGTNSLSVFVDGVNQYGPGAQYSYVETDSTTVTFNSGLHVGAEVKFTSTQQQGAGAVDASQVTYDPPFTGGVATNVQNKLAEYISTADFGIPGDLTDDGSNHTRLQSAAIAAIENKLPLKVVGRILVSDTVDWDTRGTAYNGIDPFVPNGVAKNFTVVGDSSGAGIYGKALAFVGASKPVIAFSTQARCGIFGLTIRLYDSTSVYDYTSFYNVTMLGVRSSDRVIVQNCRIGALGYPNGSNNPGAGTAVNFDDSISVQVLENDIQYVTKRGIFFSKTGGAMRDSTSCLIQGNHFSVGDPSATNRTNCEALVPSINNYIIGNVFENYSVGRAIQVVADGAYIAGNWFEGNYDTILVSSGTYHTIIGNYGIGYNPALALIEATGGAVAGGVVAIANSDATSLRTSNISHITGVGGTGSQWQNIGGIIQRRNQSYPPVAGALWNVPNPLRFADADSTGASSRTNPPLQIENLGGYFGLIASIVGANDGEAGFVVKAPSASSYAVMRLAAAGGSAGENLQLRFGNWTNPSNTGSGTLAIEAGSVSGIALVIYGYAGTRTVILDNISP